MSVPALQIQGLTKKYSSALALDDVTLTIEKGSFFALLGPNGAGKTTLISIISSLKHKTAGEVFIEGVSIDNSPDEVKHHIGLVPQEFNFNMFEKVMDIVLDQAGYYGKGRSQIRERAEYLLKELGLFEKRFEKARSLSGGMKRRLMIARALIHSPRILLLDEPTAGVDVELRRQMWKFLRELNSQGTTIILTTHYLEEAEALCDSVAVLHKGKIVVNETVEDILARGQNMKLEDIYMTIVEECQNSTL